MVTARLHVPFALLASAIALLLLAAPARAAFGVESFTVIAEKAGGGAETQAGAHPAAFRAHLDLDTEAGAQRLRDLRLALPPGFLINPTAVDECGATAFANPRNSPYEASASGESCPDSSQVGVLTVRSGSLTRTFGLFNLVPPFGAPASLGASPFGVPLRFDVHLSEPDDLALELTGLSPALDLRGLDLTVWGTPWQGVGPSDHDPRRGNCLDELSGGSHGECLVFGGAPAPESLIESYLTMPTTPCGGPLSFAATAVSSQGQPASAAATAPPLERCNKALTTPKVQLMTDAAAARTGLAFNLAVNDGGGITNPGGIARPPIRTAIVALPEGLTINPSLGAGLGVCGAADFARETAISEPGAGCPNNSKIGTVALEGTLGLAEALQGSVYLARPYENPTDSLLGAYLLARNARRGLIVKARGAIVPDPASGRLVATFDELPRLLYTHFALTLREGQRSTLISPPACGSYLAQMRTSSWAEPDVFATTTNAFLVNRGDPGPCPPSGSLPFEPRLLAGSISPYAGASTPFYLRMTRADGEQEITSYSATFPPGLLARIAGVGTCPDAAIAAAATRTGIHGGAEELASPSCPASSLIGHTEAGYGVGGVLAWAPGSLYLAGPYHGAPLSVVAIDSALIGPFDLGVVVVRSAIRIDPRTAQASIDSAGSDPIPHILKGIPLHLRDIRVNVDRPDFTVNPTSCDRTQVSSLLGGSGADPLSPGDDTNATSTQRFQLLGCTVLGFKPALALRLTGAVRHGGYPALRATYSPRPKDANLGAVSVTLPPSVFLAQNHIEAVCTRVQFARDACPAASVYGHARVITPLMDEPLEGPVYLRSSHTAVPDLVVELEGRGIEIEAPARIDSSRAGIRANFEGLPDAAVSKFVLTLPGGKHGLLQNGEDLCVARKRANARFVAQSNATAIGHPKLTVKCGKHGKVSRSPGPARRR